MNSNIAARLLQHAAAYPDRPAIIDCGGGRRRAVTYRELAARVAATGAGLAARGVRRGDRVLLFVPMSLDLYVALLGVLHLGAEAVFVDAWAGRARVDAAVAAANPRAWIATPRAQLLRLVSPALRRIPVSVIAGGWWPLHRIERRADASDASDAAVVDASTTALVTFTTGSTGAPKAAARSHGFLWAQHLALAAHLQHTDADVDMPTLPVFVLHNLALGITSVLPDFDPRTPSAIKPATILANMRNEGVTTLVASPAFCARLADHATQCATTLPLRRLFTGGAPVLPPLVRQLAHVMPTGAEVVYGSTEAEPIAGIAVEALLPTLPEGDAGPAADGLCAGRPVPTIRLRIVRAHDAPISVRADEWAAWELPVGETGEILVSGGHVLTGYLNDAAAERESKVNDGERIWHRTGDAGYVDAEGRLWLMGRLQGRVVRDGRTWWPLPAELRAFAVEGITHAAYVCAEPGERAVLCVEAPNVMDRPTAEARLRAALAPWPLDAVLFFDHIPRDPRHESKTDQRRLLAEVQRLALT